VARLVEVLQPLSLRADRLAGMGLFAGLRWSDLEFVADLFQETEVERGTQMTVQGRPSSRLWLITQGEALVSANARPLRVAGPNPRAGRTTRDSRAARGRDPGAAPASLSGHSGP
jgi:hypothetical protein